MPESAREGDSLSTMVSGSVVGLVVGFDSDRRALYNKRCASNTGTRCARHVEQLGTLTSATRVPDRTQTTLLRCERLVS